MHVIETWNWPLTFASHDEAQAKARELASERAAAQGAAISHEGIRSVVVSLKEDGVVLHQLRPTALTATGESLPDLQWGVQISTVHLDDTDLAAVELAKAARRHRSRSKKGA